MTALTVAMTLWLASGGHVEMSVTPQMCAASLIAVTTSGEIVVELESGQIVSAVRVRCEASRSEGDAL